MQACTLDSHAEGLVEGKLTEKHGISDKVLCGQTCRS